jgi:hypothetical protein
MLDLGKDWHNLMIWQQWIVRSKKGADVISVMDAEYHMRLLADDRLLAILLPNHKFR